MITKCFPKASLVFLAFVMIAIMIQPSVSYAEQSPDETWIVEPSLNYSFVFELSNGIAVANVGGGIDLSLGEIVGGKFGYIDLSGNEITSIKYSDAKRFTDGLGAVRKGEGANAKWGFVDSSGKEVIPLIYEDVESFNYGLAWAKKNGLWGFIDKDGKTVLPFIYDQKVDKVDGLVEIHEINQKAPHHRYHLYNRSQRKFVYTNADEGFGYTEGLYMVEKGNKKGYIDPTGKVVVPITYDWLEGFSDGLAIVGKQDAKDRTWKFGYINKNGQIAIPIQYRSATPFSEGIAAVSTSFRDDSERWSYQLIDKSGKDILGKKLLYSDIEPFTNGLAVVHQIDLKNNWHEYSGLINTKGEVVLPIQYDQVDAYQWGDFGKKVFYPKGSIILTKDRLQGFANRNGKVVLKPTGGLDVFSNEAFEVAGDNNLFELMDAETGQIIDGSGYLLSTIYSKVSEEYTVVSREITNNSYSFIIVDGRGKQVSPRSYTFAFGFQDGITVKVDGKWGIMANPADAPSDWAKSEINEAKVASLVPSNMQFGYKQNINRLDFCRLVVNLLSASEGSSIEDIVAANGKTIDDRVFNDTKDKSVLAAYALGIVGGKGQGIFDPNGFITRQEAAVMLANTAKFLDIKPAGGGTKFADDNTVASWAKDAVAVVSAITDKSTQGKLMGSTGNNNFSPKGFYTREQAFVTIKRLHNAQ